MPYGYGRDRDVDYEEDYNSAPDVPQYDPGPPQYHYVGPTPDPYTQNPSPGQISGWPAPPQAAAPTPAPATPAAPTPQPQPQAPHAGGGSGGGGRSSTYRPPALQPSPFVMPNGQIPPGMPFSPDPKFVSLQNQLMERIMGNDLYDQNYINQMNEQQKELLLAREQQGQRGVLQRAANRGVLGGGQVQAGMRRLGDETTRGLAQSQRDIGMRVQEMNREAMLNALGMSEGILGGRESRGLDTARFGEGIRQFDQSLLNRQAEFGSGLDFDYNRLGFDYDALNSGNYNAWLAYLARLAGK